MNEKTFELSREGIVLKSGGYLNIVEYIQDCIYDVLEFAPLLEMDEVTMSIFFHSDNYETLEDDDYEALRKLGIEDISDDARVTSVLLTNFNFTLVELPNNLERTAS